MAMYNVEARYTDPDIQAKTMRKEKTDIAFAMARYTISVDAEDMKKAYDIVEQYLPHGAEIQSINKDRNSRYANSEPF